MRDSPTVAKNTGDFCAALFRGNFGGCGPDCWRPHCRDYDAGDPSLCLERLWSRRVRLFSKLGAFPDTFFWQVPTLFKPSLGWSIIPDSSKSGRFLHHLTSQPYNLSFVLFTWVLFNGGMVSPILPVAITAQILMGTTYVSRQFGADPSQ